MESRSLTRRSSYSHSDSDAQPDGDESSEVTRCICGHQELQPQSNSSKADPDFFIQCDMCHVWQHGFCVGILDDQQAPELYYCEKCRPDFHVVVVRPSGKTSKYSPVEEENEDEEEEEEEEEDDDDGEEEVEDEEQEQEHKQDQDQNQEDVEAEVEEEEKKIPERNGYGRRKGSHGKSKENGNSQKQHNHHNHHNHEERNGHGTRDRNTHNKVTPKEEQRKEQALQEETRRRNNRSTLNSRMDAAYEETLQRVLRESANEVARSSNTTSYPDGRVNDDANSTTVGSLSRVVEVSPPIGSDIDNMDISTPMGKSLSNKKKRKRARPPTSTPLNGPAYLDKPSKPRLPQPKSTFPDMQKRVAAILEFISRTRIDLSADQEEWNRMKELQAQGNGSTRNQNPNAATAIPIKKEGESSNDFGYSFRFLEELDGKLRNWEKMYGSYLDNRDELRSGDREEVES